MRVFSSFLLLTITWDTRWPLCPKPQPRIPACPGESLNSWTSVRSARKMRFLSHCECCPSLPGGDRKHQYLRTPFVDDKEERVDELTDGLQEVQEGELRVKAPEEVPWIGDWIRSILSKISEALTSLIIDLLLEISMTTAFASLTCVSNTNLQQSPTDCLYQRWHPNFGTGRSTFLRLLLLLRVVDLGQPSGLQHAIPSSRLASSHVDFRTTHGL